MQDFVIHYLPCVILVSIGLLFMIVSYFAIRAERSPAWFIGGLFIAAGFLTTPHKWLAVLGLLDQGFWSLGYALITEHLYMHRISKYCQANGLTGKSDDTRRIVIVRIPDRNEVLEYPYITGASYNLNTPKLLFGFGEDAAGHRFLLMDPKCRGKQFLCLPFDSDSIELHDLKARKQTMNVIIEIRDAPAQEKSQDSIN